MYQSRTCAVFFLLLTTAAAGKADVVKNTSEFRLNNYTMEDIKLVPLSSSSGLLIYKILRHKKESSQCAQLA